MSRLKDFEEDIYKCSRCGLCQSVCPVYKVTLNECSVSKAKFTMLNGIVKGDLSLNSRIKSYLDLCTGCNACKNFCPSGIDAVKIFTAVKNEYYRTHKISWFEKMLNSYFLFKLLLRCARVGFWVYRALGLDVIIENSKKFVLKFGFLGKRVLLLNSLVRKSYYGAERVGVSKKLKAVYFKGCFNKYLNSETEEAVRTILEKSDVEIVEKDFECCGVGYLNDGLIDEFLKLVQINLDKCALAYDYVLTDCASCSSVLREYKNYSSEINAQDFSSKVTSVSELINSLEFVSKDNFKIAIHKPCHEDFDFVELVKNVKNTNYIEAEDFDKCCGFSGKFALKNPEISKEISRRKAQKYLDAGVDIVLTTCPACVLGLEQGFIESASESSQKSPKVMNLFVFLAKHCS